MQNAIPRLSIDHVNSTFTKHYRCFRLIGLNLLEQSILAEVASWSFEGKALTSSKSTLAAELSTSLASVKRAVRSLCQGKYILVNTFIREGKQRISEITLGPAALELLTGANKPQKSPVAHDVPVAIVAAPSTPKAPASRLN